MADRRITPFLMFSGQAEEAMKYYVSIFDRSEILAIQRYGPNEAGPEGTVVRATFALQGYAFSERRREAASPGVTGSRMGLGRSGLGQGV